LTFYSVKEINYQVQGRIIGTVSMRLTEYGL